MEKQTESAFMFRNFKLVSNSNQTSHTLKSRQPREEIYFRCGTTRTSVTCFQWEAVALFDSFETWGCAARWFGSRRPRNETKQLRSGINSPHVSASPRIELANGRARFKRQHFGGVRALGFKTFGDDDGRNTGQWKVEIGTEIFRTRIKLFDINIYFF